MSKLSEQQEKFYVYLYRIDGEIAYVGKGQGKRAYAHLNKADNPILRHKISVGQSVQIKIIKRDMNEGDAFRLERRCINKWNETVCNRTQGTRSQTEALYFEALHELTHNVISYGEAFAGHARISSTPYENIKRLAWYKRQWREMMQVFAESMPSLNHIKISNV